MRLGPNQRKVISYLAACGTKGGAIWAGMVAREFRGLDYEQVDRAAAALLRRGVIRRDGIRYILTNSL